MSTEIYELGNSLMAAVLEPEPDRRRDAIDLWKASAIPTLQDAIPGAVDDYLARLTEGTWTYEGWAARESKWRDTVFNLILDVRLQGIGRWETDTADSKWYVPFDPLFVNDHSPYSAG